MEDIGNALRDFVKIVDQTKKMRYVSYDRICVYLDISKDPLESIKLSRQDKKWIQDIDYEHIPFRYHKCHEYGHLFRECPRNGKKKISQKNAREKDAEGFEKVSNNKRMTK